MDYEKILVLKRKEIFGENDEKKFMGFKSTSEFEINKEILNKAEFKFRKVNGEGQEKAMEEDPTYKQIIPYLILKFENKYFCYKRTNKAGEKRLHDNYSIGIGGHINPIDKTKNNNLILTSIKREFEEEVKYAGKTEPKLIGYINDDTNPVGEVHLAMVYLIELENQNVTLNEIELNDGKLMDINEIKNYYNNLESWSQIVYNYLNGETR